MNTTSTATADHCRHCQAVIHDRDQYCRHCGRELEARTALLAGTGDISKHPTAELVLPASAYITAPLEARRPVSGSLLKLMAEETAPEVVIGGNRRLRLLTLALISLPIWLMIVLLSPLDAYAATKAVGRRM